MLWKGYRNFALRSAEGLGSAKADKTYFDNTFNVPYFSYPFEL